MLIVAGDTTKLPITHIGELLIACPTSIQTSTSRVQTLNLSTTYSSTNTFQNVSSDIIFVIYILIQDEALNSV